MTIKNFLLPVLLCWSMTAAGQEGGISFRSSDARLEQAFNWAKSTALSYKGKPGDPVGPWYESALPPRSAFCMRDVAHQSIGGEILGLAEENKNMLTLFAKNISGSKDWCSYWEMNREGRPAPEDYRNDKEFWYNLNANFDVMNACWRMYLWTGDKEYISGKDFRRFHEKSVEEYIQAWTLQPDSLFARPLHPNAPVPFNERDAFHRCRGLPSYSEGVPGLKMGVDLVAALYRGMQTYGDILEENGQNGQAGQYRRKAAQYQQHLDSRWWDDSASLYNTHVTRNGAFGKGEGETFLLWFDALKDPFRMEKTIAHLLAGKWNVENLSYFPYLLSKFGYADRAYGYIIHLSDPGTARREYPEVSFGVMEGIVRGLMGVDADARYNRVSTFYQGNEKDNMMLEGLPVLGARLSVGHEKDRSWLRNDGEKPVIWRAKFAGDHSTVKADGKTFRTKQEKDRKGRTVSYADISIAPGAKVTARLK